MKYGRQTTDGGRQLGNKRRQTAANCRVPMTDDRERSTRRWSVVGVLSCVCALLFVATPAITRAQGQPVTPPTVQQPTTPSPQKRKSLEIRGQAPAPEVVTVRPREIPQFQRKIITPILFTPAPAAPAIAYYIVLPGPLPEPRTAAPQNPAPKPF